MIINGSLNLDVCRNLKSLGKLKEVKKDLACSDEIKDLGDLEYVGKNLDLTFCKDLKSLGDLKHVGGDLYLNNCDNLKDLGNLEYVGDFLSLNGCINLKSLGKLKEVKGYIYIRKSGITKEYIEKNYPHFLDKTWYY